MLKSQLVRQPISDSFNLQSKRRRRQAKLLKLSCEMLSPNSESDEEIQIAAPKLRGAMHDSRYSLRKRNVPRINFRDLVKYQGSSVRTVELQTTGSLDAMITKTQQNPPGMNLKQQLNCTNTVKHPLNVSFDRVTRDEIVRKTSSCVSFYGNFVIIPALRKTLDKIENMDQDAKFNYWHEVMAFIDSYDLPYTDRQRKDLIDELVENIAAYVVSEGISIQDWEKIISTLPDDVSSRFDYRLDDSLMKEIEILGEHDRLPFDLSKPILRLLESARKQATDFIRDNSC